MKNKLNLGQSIVELLFAVGIIILVVTGIIALTVNNINSKSRGFDRKKATELSQLVLENLLDKKKNDSVEFWKLENLANKTWPTSEFIRYVYSVNFTNITTADNPKCGIGITDCAYAVVQVGWSGVEVSEENTVTFNRFFSRQGD